MQRRIGLFLNQLTRLVVPLLVVTLSTYPAGLRPQKRDRKVVFVAGTKSHGPGEHEYAKGLTFLANSLRNSPNVTGFSTAVYLNGWPKKDSDFDDADAIVFFCDGADRHEADHPMLSGDRLAVIDRQMKRGCGLVLLHYSTFVPALSAGPKFMEWVGGFFDYQTGDGPNHWKSKIQVVDTTVRPVAPSHPISSGLKASELHDELYYAIRFDEPDRRRTSILEARIPGEATPQSVAWATQRDLGGRGFVFTGGHFDKNWEDNNIRRMTLNAIVWAANGRVPRGGVDSTPMDQEFVPVPSVRSRDSVNWSNVGEDKGASRFSTLSQINRQTVKDLAVAWTYHTGDQSKQGSTIECTPIVIDGVMFITTVSLKIVALDAASGKPIWEYDPHSKGVNRGVTYWSDQKPGGVRRIIAALADGQLISLDAKTGLPDRAFGRDGVVQLRDGIARDLTNVNYGSTSAPAIFEDIVIVPIINSEQQPGGPGDIRAFNVRTGKQIWQFHTVPRPDEFGNQTWAPDSWRDRSGVNAWSGYTVDVEHGLVFAGLGSASSDFYGADRLGQNLFANCTIALDARTGKRRWHFQTVHHDLWDHDLPCPPVVCRLRRNGKLIDVVAQPTKTGFIFIFDRLTGQPIYGVREIPAQASDLMGEHAWPTQPVPLRPPALEPQLITEKDFTDLSPAAHAFVAEKAKRYRMSQEYLPPSEQGSLVSPGFHGGANWSGASVDPTTNTLYINTNNVPFLCAVHRNTSGGYDFAGYEYFNDQNGFPGVKPPWGHLTAIDLSTGTFKWRVPFGEYPALRAKGIPPTGTQSFGGTIVTSGGLVFIGGTLDEKFHAYDKATGNLLWEHQLNFGGYATPSTYMVNGRQYVVIAAGGGGKLGTKSGDEFVAFALPASTHGVQPTRSDRVASNR